MTETIAPVSRDYPVVTVQQLIDLTPGNSLEDGFSIHHGILVAWSDGHDTRVLSLIDQEWPPGRAEKRPLAVSYRRGGIYLLWPDEARAITEVSYYDWYGYNVPDGDMWSASHYYLDDGNVRDFKRPFQPPFPA